MKIVILAVGPVRNRAIAAAVEEYQRRARSYFRLETIEIPDPRGGRGGTRRPDDDEAVLRRLPEDLESFALTRTGRMLSSIELADLLGGLATYGRPGAVFIVGGATGLGRRVLEAVDHTLSLSHMTLPHEMARLVLTEQIYRAGSILRGEPYHKGS